MHDTTMVLRRMIEQASRISLFTGASISTESGIPDFRSPGGVWTRERPIPFEAFLSSEEARRETWRRRFALEPVLRAARPNRGHVALAALVASGRAEAVVTQNIDGLHQAAGVPAERVIELHGNTTYATCLDCGARHEIAALEAAFAIDPRAPRCAGCGGLVKTATISFGQPMPAAAMARAEAVMTRAELCLVVGSSLVVWPAAGLPVAAKRAGAALAIVNREPTALDDLADLTVRGEIGAVLGAAVGVQ
ncbi:MAG: SIR2 family NAD-dependent protein deacylase [Acetobacteraceae bacterium]